MFGGVDDGEQRARDIFAKSSALLEPEFEQQRQQLQSDLFGSGRLGLQLAGETAGARNWYGSTRCLWIRFSTVQGFS